MASSFITKDSVQGFWVKDALMQVVCWGLEKVIGERYKDSEQWLADFRLHIYDNSQGIFVGFMHLNLEEYLTTQKRKDIFTHICELTKELFLSKGEFIPVQDLNTFQQIEETKREWQTPLETWILVKILDCIIDISNDRFRNDEMGCRFL